MRETGMDSEQENEDQGSDNAAFQNVYDKQEALQELLDTGGEADEDAAQTLAEIKSAGQMLLDAINNLSLTDFEEWAAETDDPSEADTLEQIFS